MLSRSFLAIAILVATLLLTGHALVRTENQRYALLVGMCSDQIMKISCLERIETRTGWWWHLYYALQN